MIAKGGNAAPAIYMVTMEYAGIAEAGGVKLVARSLCEELSRLGYAVTAVMPRFGITNMEALHSVKKAGGASFKINGKREAVTFVRAALGASGNAINVILVCSPHFAQKGGIYTYTAEEEKDNPQHKKGTGHEDARLLDTLLCKAAAYLAEHPLRGMKRAEVLLCEDAACACTPAYITERKRRRIKSIVTIHNAAPAYHHEFKGFDEAKRYTGLPAGVLCGAFNKTAVEPYLIAAEYAALTTVSGQYAAELTAKDSGEKTDGLSEAFRLRSIEVLGILNGIDYARYDPASDDSLLPYKYSPIAGDFEGKAKCREYLLDKYFASPASPLEDSAREKGAIFCFHGRMVRQKGILILADAMETVLRERDGILFVAMGQGEEELEERMRSLCNEHKGRAVYIKGYEQALSRLIIASSDFIVLPSHTEPCGQEDYIAQIYGTLPVAHATGGLKKIEDGKTGFLYAPNTGEALSALIYRLADEKKANAKRLLDMACAASKSVKEKHSWENAVRSGYLPLFAGANEK